MRIAVNTRTLIQNKLEGIGWFTFETLKRITNNHPEHQFFFLFDRKPSPSFLFAPNITPIVLSPQARHPFLWYIWFEWQVTRFLEKNRIDLFLSTDGFLSLRTKVPSLAVIHDLNFLHYKKGLPYLTQAYFEYFFRRFAKHAKRIATVSEFSKNDIVEKFSINPDLIDVAYNGANPIFSPLNEQEKEDVKIEYSRGTPYFVFVGALNPRKNVCRLLEAFDIFCSQVPEKHSLVIVGERMFRASEVFNTYRAMEFRNRVVFTGRLPVGELRRVIGGATALAYVPYFEGFGIPLVEAMACHVPIIASNVTSIPEVAQSAALYVDPFSIEDIANALTLIATNEQMRKDLVAKGAKRKELFSWDNTAAALYQSMERVMKGS